MKIFGFIIILCLIKATAFTLDSNVEQFWKNWEKSDYEGAKKYGEAVCSEKPEYLIPLYYIDQIDPENGYQEVIEQLLAQRKGSIGHADNLPADCKLSIGDDSFLYYYIQAVIQNLKKSPFNESLDKSLNKKESADALLFRFFNSKEHSVKDLLEAKNILPGNPSVLFYNLRANLIQDKNTSNSLNYYYLLVISNKTPLLINDYRYLGQVFLGANLPPVKGPGGPNGEPYYGELYQVTNWPLVNMMDPVHRLFFACTVGYGGFQNSADAERILKDIPGDLQDMYHDEIYILRIFENFNSYNYDNILNIASEAVSNKMLSSRMIYNDYYNMAYQLEMQAMKFKINKLMEASVLLYRKAFENIPDWASFSRNYIAFEWSRALYYTARYGEAASLLEKNVDLSAFPFATVILSWSYYRLNDKINGKKYEDLFNKNFTDQKKIRTILP